MRTYQDGPDLVIGLVNNMPAGAFDATLAQFAALLRASAGAVRPGLRVRLRCFAPEQAGSRCESLEALWRARLDGLIVTGAPPQADTIAGEPLWPTLARIADWAAANTEATIWSCLAAHAAAHHLDGVERHRLPHKLSGVYRCDRDATDGLMSDAPASWPVPHSRYYDLDATALQNAGYRILSRGPGGAAGMLGVDSFQKNAGRSCFLMLQGHPEFSAETLWREYRRDVRDYLTGRSDAPPAVPVDYFDPAVADRLADLPCRLAGQEIADAMSTLDGVAGAAPPSRWDAAAVALFKRWLSQLAGKTDVALWQRQA